MTTTVQNLVTSTNSTSFELVGWGMVLAASRGITFKLNLAANGQLKKTVWGKVRTNGRALLNQFELDVSCDDNWPPGFVGLWKGTQLVVNMTDEFCQPASQPQVRPSADGNLYWFDAQMIQLPTSAGAAWLRYRPQFNMVVDDWNQRPNEWSGETGWTLKLVETAV